MLPGGDELAGQQGAGSPRPFHRPTTRHERLGPVEKSAQLHAIGIDSTLGDHLLGVLKHCRGVRALVGVDSDTNTGILLGRSVGLPAADNPYAGLVVDPVSSHAGGRAPRWWTLRSKANPKAAGHS